MTCKIRYGVPTTVSEVIHLTWIFMEHEIVSNFFRREGIFNSESDFEVIKPVILCLVNTIRWIFSGRDQNILISILQERMVKRRATHIKFWINFVLFLHPLRSHSPFYLKTTHYISLTIHKLCLQTTNKRGLQNVIWRVCHSKIHFFSP